MGGILGHSSSLHTHKCERAKRSVSRQNMRPRVYLNGGVSLNWFLCHKKVTSNTFERESVLSKVDEREAQVPSQCAQFFHFLQQCYTVMRLYIQSFTMNALNRRMCSAHTRASSFSLYYTCVSNSGFPLRLRQDDDGKCETRSGRRWSSR